ncbi:MAG: Ig-like domain-containing protein [Mariniphaga sp.]|nr:Ig-like domain-containing protein [Mariniphaga sp.]
MFFLIPGLSGKVVYVSPDGTGDGTSKSTPMKSLSAAVKLLKPGDELILLKGEYKEALVMRNIRGTESSWITIKAEEVCEAFINGNAKLENAVEIQYCSYIKIDGLKAGNTQHTAWSIGNCNNMIVTRCAGLNAGYLVAQDGHAELSFNDNCHIFGIAYSDRILAEDVWAWGTGRYDFMFFQSSNCTVRRGVFRPTNTELGYGYDRGPHSGFNLYDCDNCIAENCIAFETRFHPESDQSPENPWALVQGGMVFDDHTLPSGYNYVLGCFDLDNGQARDIVPRSNPAVHLMSKWSGQLEDVVIWKNALNYGIIVNTSGKVDLPKRALIGSPSKIKQNNVVTENLNYRYVDGNLTTIPLWPWPYEDIIKEQMEMEETMTQYVSRMVHPHILLDTTVIPVEGVVLDSTSVTLADGGTIQLTATVFPDTARNRTLIWSSSDTTVARVDASGLVTAAHGTEGMTTITVTTHEGNFSASCQVTVDLVSSASHPLHVMECRIYPNPVTGNYFYVDVQGIKTYNFQLINLVGQVVNEEKGWNGLTRISAEGIKPGVYLAKIVSEEKIVAQKMIIR